MTERTRSLLRQAGLASLATAATVLFCFLLNRHYPLKDWLFFRYAGYFALAFWVLASGGLLGHAIVVGLLGPEVGLSERLLYSFAIGLLVFALGWAALGFLGLYGAVTFVLWPFVLSALGLWMSRGHLRRYRGFVRRAQRLRRPLGFIEMAAIALAGLGVVLAYAPIMTPINVAFDSRWYHIAMGEHYAIERGIVRFSDGWMLGGYPQLSAYLYSWGFCLPGGSTFDRIELCTHLEFVIFLATLASVPILVRRIVPAGSPGVRVSWTAVFLFPELFLYDSSLNGGADHIAAFWAVPLFLALLRAQRRLALRPMLLLGCFVAAVILTKYTACGLLVVPGLVIAWRIVRSMWASLRGPRRDLRFLIGPVSLVALVLGLTTPHWLKNALWYRDPLFPLLHAFITPDPWTEESVARLSMLWQGDVWRTSKDFRGVLATLRQLYEFSFVPKDFATFHRDWPMFGSLFTLMAPLLLLVRTRRLLLLFACANAGVLYWYWTFHQDRYLQVYVPWMAAAVAAVCSLTWREGRWTRVPLLALVLLQAVWGGDAPFFSTHAMGKPLRATLDLLGGGFAGKGDQRFVSYGDWEQIDRLLPEGSRLLRHDNQVHLGVGSPTLTDWFQTAFSHGRAPDPADIHRSFREHGVTHVLWPTDFSIAFDSIASDLGFFNYATRYAEPAERVGAYSVARLPEQAPEPLGRPLLALFLGCSGFYYDTGLYDVRDLNVMPVWGLRRQKNEFPKPQVGIFDKADVNRHIDRADAIVHNPKCFGAAGNFERRGFMRAARRGEDILYVRRRK